VTRQPGLRADAARNRAAILQAARTLIAAHGTDIGMDDIAAAAGVAVGTLYRHFPTKNDLVRAIMADLGTMVADTLDSALARVDSGHSTALKEIATLLHRVVVEMGQERLLRLALADVETDALRTVHERAATSVARLIAAAHRDHALRADITVDDITLLLAASPGTDIPRSARLRWVELARRALVPDGHTD
jgi:AcrR family transcriptional regulator